MKWAGGAGRHEGVHMVHTFEEVRTRTPANPNEAAPEAIMPQAAWEAGGKRGAHETTHVPKAGRNRSPTTNTTNSRH